MTEHSDEDVRGLGAELGLPSTDPHLDSYVRARGVGLTGLHDSAPTLLGSLTRTLFLVKPREIGALTGLRGVAAVWVLAFHIAEQPNGTASSLADILARAGYIGVDLFFVLSGFVIAENYQHFFRPWDFPKYWRFQVARLGRIYPVHLVMLLGTLAIVAVAALAGYQRTTAGVDYSPEAFIANLLLIQAWGWPHYSWNWVAWTISAEWFAYLLFPFAAYAVFSRVATKSARILVVVVIYAVMLSVSTWVGPARIELSLLRVTAGFTSGVVVWLWTRDRPPSEIAGGLMAFIAIGGLVATIILLSAFRMADGGFWPAPWFVLLVLGVSGDRGPIARVLSSVPAIFFGRISYSLYMVHSWVLIAVRTFVASRVDASLYDIVVLLLVPTISFAVATVMFLVIEEPFRKRAKGLARRGEPQVP